MLRLRTLGPLGLDLDGGEEVRTVLAQPKRMALLVYLALAGGWQRRDRVVALFWPELDAEHARNALNQALFFLRRHLGPETIRARHSEEIGLAPETLWCDAVAFEEAVAAGKLAEAVDLYRGELLAGFHVPDAASELDRWIDAERHRLARQFAGALDALAEAHERQGDYTGSALWWRRRATRDPYDGRVALRLMRALAAAGDRSGALEHARIHTVLIRQELEAEPEPEIAALTNQLRQPSNAAVTVMAGAPAPARAEAAGDDALTPPANGASDTNSMAGTNGTHTSNVTGRVGPRWLLRHYPARQRVTIAVALLAVLTLAYRAKTGHADPTIRAIAVLPFANLTNDPSKEYLADVMTDALITELARYPELRITSRMSVLQYKGTAHSAAEIAGALHIDAFVEGTLAGDGRTVQVTAQLINAGKDRHVWADRYVRDSANLLAIESDIAAAIAREVNVRAVPVAEQPERRRSLDRVSYSLYLRGQMAMLKRTPAAMDEARAYFHQAVAQDSTFALGYAGLSEAILVSGVDGFMPLPSARDSASQFARRAIALDSLLPQGHTALAAVYGDGARWAEAESEYRRAIQLGPSDASAYHWYAMQLFIHDRFQEAYAIVKVGRALDPTSAALAQAAGPIETALGIGRGSSRRAAQTVLRDPFYAWSRASYANRLSEEGKCAEARANIDTAKAMIPDNIRMEVSVFAVEYRCGDRKTAMGMFGAMKHRADARTRGLWIATVYRSLNQTDSAFAWLDSVEWNGDLRFNFRARKEWNSSRNDPRYQRVLQQMGLK